MSLARLPTQTSYNTSTDRIIKSFYTPALQAAIHYDRGVGYFTSNWLKMASDGLADFSSRGGTARFIVSPHMSAEDWAACRQGLDARTDPILIEALRVVTEDLPHSLETRTLTTLSWMIADGLLDIRIAMPIGTLHGDFHDKFGIFRDQHGHMLSFHGSPNDSAKAFQNYESISAFYSWVDDREFKRTKEHHDRFALLWSNKDPNVAVFDLPEAIRKNLAKFSLSRPRPYPGLPSRHSPEPDKWQHQHHALTVFLEKQHGVLEMATGTGKTRTAINILRELSKRNLITTVIITMNGTDLLQQWYNTLLRSIDLTLYRHYGGHSDASEYISAPPGKVLLISRQHLATVLPVISTADLSTTLLICDEVHGFGSPSMIRTLSGILRKPRFRLGLSATPEREYDAQGNDFIENEIGPVIFEFTLEDAIHKGVLCEFDYTALPYTLSTNDRAAIRQAFARHHARRREGNVSSDEVLYREIALVRKTSLSKIKPFCRHVAENPNLYRRSLLFVETAEFGRTVQPILINARVDYHTYYQTEDRAVLERFARGDLDCLISCHRLSEGLDIQSVENIVLFSSARARLETIQRLGRCLRVDPANPSKRAHVLDFIDEEAKMNDATTSETDSMRYRFLTGLSRIRCIS